MGQLYSNFVSDLMQQVFSGSGKLGLGTGETTPVSVTKYKDQAGSAAGWQHSFSGGVAEVTNSRKFYFPDATAAYTASHFLVKRSFGGKTDAILVSIPFTDASGDPSPLAVDIGEQIKINAYRANAGRGVRVRLWQATGV